MLQDGKLKWSLHCKEDLYLIVPEFVSFWGRTSPVVLLLRLVSGINLNLWKRLFALNWKGHLIFLALSTAAFSSGSLKNWQPVSFKAEWICLASLSSIQRQCQVWHLATGLDVRAIPHHIHRSICQKCRRPETFFSMENSFFWRDQRF